MVAFFGDLKMLGGTPDKTKLLLAYFAPCLAAGSLVVIFWGCAIAIGRSIAVIRKTDNGYGVADAVGDYFFMVTDTIG